MIYVLLALEVVLLAVVLWLGDRKQRAEAERQLRQTTLQVALFSLGKGVPSSPSKANGVTEGDRYQPAPSSGPQRVVE